MADYSDSEDSIDVLIGPDYYWDFVTSEIVRGDFGPTAVNSKFGWLLSGPTESVINQETTVTNLTIAGNSNSLFDYTQHALVDTLKQFWETGSIGIKEVSEITKSHNGFNEQVVLMDNVTKCPCFGVIIIQQYPVTMNFVSTALNNGNENC